MSLPDDVPTSPQMRGWRLAAFGGALLAAMFVSTFPQYALGVLAPVILDEYGLSEGEFGLIASMLFLSAAIMARFGGRLFDVLSGRSSLATVFISAITSLIILAVAGSRAGLVLAALVGGLAAAINNPVTNRLIALHAPEGRRGPLMGVKQTGVKLGHMTAGAALPFFVLTIGWRTGLIVIAGTAAAMLVIGSVALPTEKEAGGPRGSGRRGAMPESIRRDVRWLQFYAGSMAIGMSALTTYLALYGVQRVGMSLTAAGLVVAVMGFTSVVGRLIWATAAERIANPPLALLILSAGGVLGFSAIAAAEAVGPWLLWVGAVGVGATAGSWNVVVQLTVVTEVDTKHTAAASGGVQAAFLGGLTVGTPIFGFIVEGTGSFRLAWSVGAMLAVLATLIAVRQRHLRGAARSQGAAPVSP